MYYLTLPVVHSTNDSVRLPGAPPVPTQLTNIFLRSHGSASPSRYYAHADLEQGVLLDMVTCVYNDGGAAASAGSRKGAVGMKVSTGIGSLTTAESRRIERITIPCEVTACVRG